MKNSPKSSNKSWENRTLGASAKHVRKTSTAKDKNIDDQLGMQSISIRLQKSLIDDLKLLAEEDGIGYQPYVRQLLMRHVRQIQEDRKERRKLKPKRTHTNSNYR